MTLGRLTPRQRDIVKLLARGLSNGEIATTLRIARPTVKNHLAKIAHRARVPRGGGSMKVRWRIVLAFYKLVPKAR